MTNYRKAKPIIKDFVLHMAHVMFAGGKAIVSCFMALVIIFIFQSYIKAKLGFFMLNSFILLIFIGEFVYNWNLYKRAMGEK
jgi:hypothetical protein